MQLQVYDKALAEFKELGAELMAISPQATHYAQEEKEAEELSFSLLSDVEGAVADKYNVLYEVPQELKELYQGFGLDITEYNAKEEWILPVPAVFIIDEEGIIQFADVDADYTNRTEPQAILAALKEL